MNQLELRLALVARGYAVDSAAGLAGAVRAFQAANGLAADGIAGPRTQATLRATIPARPSPAVAPIGGLTAVLTVARLRKMEPFARADILAAIVAGIPAIEAAGITTPRRLAHFLGQVAHESGGLARTEEALSYSAARLCQVWPSRFPTLAAAAPFAANPRALAVRVYGGRLGNAPAPSADGWTYRGSGGLGTTGEANFREAGFADRPDELRKVENFLAPALLYWRTRGCNALADAGDLDRLTVRINGGSIGLDDRRTRTQAALRIFVG